MLFRLHRPALAVCALLLSLSAPAQSLLEATQAALAHDARWQAQSWAVAAAGHQHQQAKAALLPQIGLQASSQHSDSQVRLDTPLGQQTQQLSAWQHSAGVQLVQPLYHPARKIGYQQGTQALALARAQQAAVQQQLLLQVAQAYFGRLAAQDAVRVQQALVQAVQEQTTLAQRNFDVGLVTITDLREAQARLDLAQAQQLALDNEAASQQLLLEKFTGMAAMQPWLLPPDTPLPPWQPQQRAQLEPWLQALPEQHPQLQQARLARDIAQLATRKAQAGHRPTVDLQASYGQQRNPDGTLTVGPSHRTTVGTVGVQLQLPLFAGFGIQEKIKESLSLEEKAQAELLEAQRTLELAVQQAYLGWQSAQQQSQALQQAVDSSRTALQASQTGYAVGVRINADVLNAQVQLYSTQKDWMRARYQALLGYLQLLQAAGRLTLDDVAQVSALLQPADQ